MYIHTSFSGGNFVWKFIRKWSFVKSYPKNCAFILVKNRLENILDDFSQTQPVTLFGVQKSLGKRNKSVTNSNTNLLNCSLFWHFKRYTRVNSIFWLFLFFVTIHPESTAPRCGAVIRASEASCFMPGTDVMILKIFSQKKIAKIGVFDSKQS
jgi:hypothetical protein